MADRLASAMGTTSIQNYEKKTVEQDFYGVYAGQSALPLKPDSLCYLTNATLEQCKVYDYQNNRPGFVYDFQRASGKDPYELFLSGPIMLHWNNARFMIIRITAPDLSTISSGLREKTRMNFFFLALFLSLLWKMQLPKTAGS